MSEVARGDGMQRHDAMALGDLTGFGQMDFEKSAVAAVEFTKWMERLDDAGSAGPPTGGSGGESDHGDLAGIEGGSAECAVGVGQAGGGWKDIAGAHVLDAGIGGQAVAGQTDVAGLEVEANAFVSQRVKSIAGQQ